jgi:hypothetical protein
VLGALLARTRRGVVTDTNERLGIDLNDDAGSVGSSAVAFSSATRQGRKVLSNIVREVSIKTV